MTFHAANICSDDFSQDFQRMCSLGLMCFSAMTLILFKCSTQKRNIAFFLSLILLLYNRPKTMKMGNAEENTDHKKAFVQG